jgi:hypothetical protein
MRRSINYSRVCSVDLLAMRCFETSTAIESSRVDEREIGSHRGFALDEEPSTSSYEGIVTVQHISYTLRVDMVRFACIFACLAIEKDFARFGSRLLDRPLSLRRTRRRIKSSARASPHIGSLAYSRCLVPTHTRAHDHRAEATALEPNLTRRRSSLLAVRVTDVVSIEATRLGCHEAVSSMRMRGCDACVLMVHSACRIKSHRC